MVSVKQEYERTSKFITWRSCTGMYNPKDKNNSENKKQWKKLVVKMNEISKSNFNYDSFRKTIDDINNLRI